MTKGSCVQAVRDIPITHPPVTIPKGSTGEIVETAGPNDVLVEWAGPDVPTVWIAIVDIKELPDHPLATETDA